MHGPDQGISATFSGKPDLGQSLELLKRAVARPNPSIVKSGIMVGLGETTEEVHDVMEQIAPYYKEKMNAFIARLTKMIEPTIIVVMGVTIAFVMTSIYLPMFEMAGKVK